MAPIFCSIQSRGGTHSDYTTSIHYSLSNFSKYFLSLAHNKNGNFKNFVQTFWLQGRVIQIVPFCCSCFYQRQRHLSTAVSLATCWKWAAALNGNSWGIPDFTCLHLLQRRRNMENCVQHREAHSWLSTSQTNTSITGNQVPIQIILAGASKAHVAPCWPSYEALLPCHASYQGPQLPTDSWWERKTGHVLWTEMPTCVYQSPFVQDRSSLGYKAVKHRQREFSHTDL